MGKRATVFGGKFLVILLGLTLVSFLGAKPAVKRLRAANWKPALKREIDAIAAAAPGVFGIYLKDLDGGEEFARGAEGPWYLASGVKLPVALTVLRAAERGQFSLDTELELIEAEKVDGPGETNRRPAGTRLTVRYLLEQMLVWSDNTASDMLIRLVGLDAVNASLREWVPTGFGPISTLIDVRRQVYGGVDPAAANLSGPDFIRLHDEPTDAARSELLAELLGRERGSIRADAIERSYERFYATNQNSATLPAYGALLERLVRGEILSEPGTKLLLEIMTRAQTGLARLKAGLPESAVFAHKTGTQRKRVCDFGVALVGGKRLVIAACTKEFPTVVLAESVLRKVAEAIAHSGLFPNEKTPVRFAKLAR